MWRSRERSATSRLSFPFSSRSCRNSRSSLGLIRVFLLPLVKRLLADAALATDFHHRRSRFSLPQHPQNLLFPLAIPGSPPLHREPRSASRPELVSGTVLRFWVNGALPPNTPQDLSQLSSSAHLHLLIVVRGSHEDVRKMLIGALGCNLAWGIIDAVFYLMARLSEQGQGWSRFGRCAQPTTRLRRMSLSALCCPHCWPRSCRRPNSR